MKIHRNLDRNLSAAAVCLFLIIFITLFSALPIGFTITQQSVSSLQREKVIRILEAGPGNDMEREQARVPVHTITFTNRFLPRQQLLPQVQACLLDTETLHGVHLETRWQHTSALTGLRGPFSSEDIVRLGTETKTITLDILPWVYWKQKGEYGNQSTLLASFDTIVIFFTHERTMFQYKQCENLQQGDIEEATRIPLTRE